MLNIVMLYTSKAGAVIVGMIILPQFGRLLGQEVFGIAAVILSIQTLLLTLDLGMSTLIGRDVSAHRDRLDQAAGSWRSSHWVLTSFYLLLALAAVPLNQVLPQPLTPAELASTLVLFWALTLQNVGQIALMAARQFVLASGIQLVGVVLRALATLVALQVISPSLTVFLAAQAATSIAHWMMTHLACARLFSEATPLQPVSLRDRASQGWRMARRGGPLILFGIAGAAVMQLDKPLVSALASAAVTAPYYLATVLCLAPLSSLAGPVAQYFQPKLTQAIVSQDEAAIRQSLTSFTTALVLVTFLPSAGLWLLREPIVSMWLAQAPYSGMVAHYTAILLPGVAVGALGYLPYSILIARQDFRFQAVASACMTLATLTAAAWVASRDNVAGVCWVYSGYHCLATCVSWLRCVHLDRGQVGYANVAGLRAAALVATVCVPTLLIALGSSFNKS